MLDRMLSSGGVDFSLDDMQASLELAIDGLDAAPETYGVTLSVLQALMAIGVKRGPRWQAEGLNAPPSEEDVAKARATNALADWYTARHALVVDAIEAGTITTQQQLIALLGGD